MKYYCYQSKNVFENKISTKLLCIVYLKTFLWNIKLLLLLSNIKNVLLTIFICEIQGVATEIEKIHVNKSNDITKGSIPRHA